MTVKAVLMNLPRTLRDIKKDARKRIFEAHDSENRANVFIIPGDFFFLMTGICVYAWTRGDDYLYVGHTGNGLSRVGNHNIIGNVEMVQVEDLIKLWMFDNYDKAILYEKELIERYIPKYNKTVPNENGTNGRKKIECLKCKKQFFQTRSWQKFCSRECQTSTPGAILRIREYP